MKYGQQAIIVERHSLMKAQFLQIRAMNWKINGNSGRNVSPQNDSFVFSTGYERVVWGEGGMSANCKKRVLYESRGVKKDLDQE